MADSIAFTCASGKQCGGILPLLYPQKSRFRLRLIVLSDSSRERIIQEYPEAEVFQANLDDPADRAKIVHGVSVLYYISPTFHPLEAELGKAMADAARDEAQRPGSKFEHFVLSSVLHTNLRKLLNHDRKRYIEEYLYESPLKWTVFQASHFMDNAIPRILALRDSSEPVFMATHNVDRTFSFSCVRDYADASVKVIEEGPKHFYGTYKLVSTWPLAYRDFIQQVGDAIGKDIIIKHATYEDTVDLYSKMIFGRVDADIRWKEGPARLVQYYNERGLHGNPMVAEWRLGRPPTAPGELARILLKQTA